MAVKKIEVLDGQSVWDVAVQVYGEGVRGVFKLMQDNPEINLTTVLLPGQLLKVPQAASNKVVAEYFTTNDLHPVGTRQMMPMTGGFSWSAFTNGFNI